MPESKKDRYEKAREEIAKQMAKEGRSSRHMTEMEWEEFLQHSSRIVADGIITSGFNSISGSLSLIIAQYASSKLLNFK